MPQNVQYFDNPDGKVFKPTPAQVSTDFGSFADEEKHAATAVPGSKTGDVAFQPDPSKP